jgi:hypothetical protein
MFRVQSFPSPLNMTRTDFKPGSSYGVMYKWDLQVAQELIVIVLGNNV